VCWASAAIRSASHLGTGATRLLISAPRRGHFMRRFSTRDVNDVFSFRSAWIVAISQALPLMTPNDHKDLRNVVKRMIAAAKAGRLTDLRQQDIALHRRICELSQNRQTRCVLIKASTPKCRC